MNGIKLFVAALLICGRVSAGSAAQTNLPSLDEVLKADQDLWGLAAMRQSNGPSYEFFEKLLPPLRYVNAEFKYYPIILSAPNATNKARLTSNGSGVNARASLKTWKEIGVPVKFFVGGLGDSEVGANSTNRLTHVFDAAPALLGGHLPVVDFAGTFGELEYLQEAFAAVESPFAEHGVVFVKFNVPKRPGTVAALIDTTAPLIVSDGAVRDTNGAALVWFSKDWEWNEAQHTLTAKLRHVDNATLAIATQPMASPLQVASLSKEYERQHDKCVAVWKSLLGRAAPLSVPEPLVTNAWRALLANNFMLLKSNRANYSAGNQYERLYQAECGDVARAFLLWGYDRDVLPMLSHQFDYTRDKLEFHNAGFKLQQFAHYYWMTRDTNGVAALRPKWEKEIKLIVGGREHESGLFPKERYCGDIAEHVYSLNPNAGCWRGLRDFAAVLDDMGEKQEAHRLTGIAKEFRAAILKAVEQSEDRTTKPPFIPIMFFGKEKPYVHLTESMLSSYWCLLAPYVIGSGVFGAPGCERERAMMDYFQERGGICMGMVRFHQHSGLFANEDALDDLYGLRYSIKLLQLDEVDRALVSFYGKLAQGLTRETFIGAEGTGLRALDADGRPMYLPPNSTAQAYFLWLLRYLLVQDWDMDDDGKPETLRLCFATPKPWLANGQTIQFVRAPTAFGPVSVKMKSDLSKGEVRAEVDLPSRNPAKKILLRARVPDGWRVTGAECSGKKLTVDAKGTVDISPLAGHQTIRFTVSR
ncbi:MAG: hypothetical protein EXS35_11635 [Pedosphaera sp.]|nr:hypothetical protein [Pedosphaera sp.]